MTQIRSLICTDVSPECPLEYTIYGYRPNLGANVFFATCFALCFVAHIGLGWYFRARGYAIAATLGCLGQSIGYAARARLHFAPFDAAAFQTQICCLVVAPAFNSAAIYLMLRHIVELFGSDWSILKPRQYTYVFITGDLISLALQAAGGGIAANSPPDDGKQLNLGNNVMMAGISFQVVTLTAFVALALLYLIRRLKSTAFSPLPAETDEIWKGKAFRFFSLGLIVGFVAIYIRCVYRIIEMKGGWRNPIMRDEVAFFILESW